MERNKPKVMKDIEKLPPDLRKEVMMKYPDGINPHLINIKDKDGNYIYVLPFETEEISYMLKVKIKKPSKAANEDEEEDDILRPVDDDETKADEYSDDSFKEYDDVE